MTRVSVRLRDWNNDFAVDPATGYKFGHEGMILAVIIKCVVCGREIPSAPVPIDSTPEQRLQILREYKCPRCGHNACLIADPAQR